MVIKKQKHWLKTVGLEISQEKLVLRLASRFYFSLGFLITYVDSHSLFSSKNNPKQKKY